MKNVAPRPRLRPARIVLLFFIGGLCGQALGSDLEIPNTFVNGAPADADEVNENFGAVEQAVDDNDARLNALSGTVSTVEAGVQSNATAIASQNTILQLTQTEVTANTGRVAQLESTQVNGDACSAGEFATAVLATGELVCAPVTPVVSPQSIGTLVSGGSGTFDVRGFEFTATRDVDITVPTLSQPVFTLDLMVVPSDAPARDALFRGLHEGVQDTWVATLPAVAPGVDVELEFTALVVGVGSEVETAVLSASFALQRFVFAVQQGSPTGPRQTVSYDLSVFTSTSCPTSATVYAVAPATGSVGIDGFDFSVQRPLSTGGGGGTRPVPTGPALAGLPVTVPDTSCWLSTVWSGDMRPGGAPIRINGAGGFGPYLPREVLASDWALRISSMAVSQTLTLVPEVICQSPDGVADGYCWDYRRNRRF